MKTLGEFRNYITDNHDVVKIGGLEFEFKGEDIDVKLDGKLIMWIGALVDDSVLLDDVNYSVDIGLEKGRKALKEKNNLESKIQELEGKINYQDKVVGMVEAYEKILIGREITIGK